MSLINDPRSATGLIYDGSHLGEFKFRDVIQWMKPCIENANKSNIWYVAITLDGINKHYAILKRNRMKTTDQVIIDEFKPIFGLIKMGTHRIRLYGVPNSVVMDIAGINSTVDVSNEWSDYLLFRCRTKLSPTGEISIRRLKRYSDYIKDHQVSPLLHDEVQKILAFRSFLRIDVSMTDILVIDDDHAMSIDEMVLKQPIRFLKKLGVNDTQEYFDATESIPRVLATSLGLNKDMYISQFENIRQSLSEIIQRLDEDKLFMFNDLIARLDDSMSMYVNGMK